MKFPDDGIEVAAVCGCEVTIYEPRYTEGAPRKRTNRGYVGKSPGDARLWAAEHDERQRAERDRRAK